MSTAFQFDAFQPDAFQVEGGVSSGEITGSLDYTNRDDAIAGSATLGGEDLTAAKYGARKRKPNPNVKFKPAVAKASPPVPEPKKPKAKPSPLVLGLLGLVGPKDPPQAAPVLVVASIPPAAVPAAVALEPVLEVALPPAAPPAPTIEQMAATLATLEAQMRAMRAELDAVQAAAARGPEPVAPTARDPVHEALLAILPGIGQPLSLDDEDDDGEPAGLGEPPAPPPAPAAPAVRPRLTPEQLRRENARRARVLAEAML